MDIEVKPLKAFNPIKETAEIEYSFFSVVKPDYIEGTTLVLQDSQGNLRNRNHSELSKGEIKKEKYVTAHYVNDKTISLDFQLTLFSELMEELMKTTLKCQVSLTDPAYIIEHNITNISDDLSEAIEEQTRNLLVSPKSETLEIIHNIIQSLPIELKELFIDYAKIDNCRLTNKSITDSGKRERRNQTLASAMQSNDIITLTEHKAHLHDVLDTEKVLLNRQHDINRKNEEDRIKTLENENKQLELYKERYETMKDTGMISQSEASEGYRQSLNQSDTLKLNIDNLENEAIEEKENTESIDDEDEKSYFE